MGRSTRSGGLLPGGEELRRAVRWIGEQGEHSAQAIEQACLRFDLTPLEEEFLLRFFRDPQAERQPTQKH